MANKPVLFNAQNQAINNRPVMVNFFKEWRDWWEGFDERDQSRLPTLEEKQKMVMYPICISVIQHKILPLLAPHLMIDGDEKQVEFLKFWFDWYYRRCIKLMAKKAVTWGFGVGERVSEPIYLNDKPYWMHVGSFLPEPFNTTLIFGEDKPSIAGFKYDRHTVERLKENGDWQWPGMVYMNYEGDETSMPYGDSILNKMFWAWQLVMKTWTTMTVYQRLHSPFIKYFYAPEKYGDTDNKAVDQGRAQAITDLTNIKNTQGVAIPLAKNKDGELTKASDLDVVAPPDKEPQFNETIRVLNSLMYVAANVPERLAEQFKDTGSQSMVETQKTYYTEYVLPDDIENIEYYTREWFTNPMLEINFGKIDCRYKFSVSDKKKALFASILEKLIASGEALGHIDIRALAEGAGVPIGELDKPTVETAERKKYVNGVEFAQGKKGDDKKRIEAWVNTVVKHMNAEIEDIKDDVWEVLKKRLEEQQGKIGIKVDRLFRKGIPKRKELQKTLQIPNHVYSGMYEYILQGWDSGQKFHFEKAGLPPMEAPSTVIADKLRTLDDAFAGSDFIAGEGELLERRLYRVLANTTSEKALAVFNTEMTNYIETTLPTRITSLIHSANKYGTNDFVRDLQMRGLETKKEGK